jgi:hypothetical protein
MTTEIAIQEQIEVVMCDRCGAPETPSNPLELRPCGLSGQGAFINEGPPECYWECAACASDDSEVPL